MSSGSSRMPNAGGDIRAPSWMQQTGGLPHDPSEIDSAAQAGLSLPGANEMQQQQQQQQTAPQSSPLLAALLSGDERRIAGSIRDWHGGVGETLRAIAARQ